MTTILVTGGAGFIGSHVCKALASAGFRPVAYDNLSTGHAHAVQWGPLEVGDLCDRGRLDQVLAAYQPAAVLHFAGLIAVGESVENPGLYYQNNVTGSLTLLQAMAAAGVGRLVFSSSCAVYGMPDLSPITEAAPLGPISPYGRSKLMVEQMLADFEHAHGLRWTALRYFNAAGSDPDGQLGEEHEPETHVIPRVVMAALGEIDHFTILGTDYDTPDGTCLRDYVHVCDLADAHLAALRRLLAGGASLAVNLGTGTGWSVRQVIQAAERVSGHRLPVAEAPRRPGDPARLVADAALASRELGFAPRHTDLDAMIRQCLNWRKKALTPA